MSKPILILGTGVQSCRELAIRKVNEWGIPVCLTWGAADLLPWNHPLRVGTFGTHGNKHANLAIQNSSFVISVGSRLDTKATGHPVSSFAPHAEVMMVDIDKTEIDKFKDLGRKVEGRCQGAVEFFETFHPEPTDASWFRQIDQWREQYPVVREEWRTEFSINPYVLVDELSNYIRPEDVIVSDTGCALGWMMQAYKFKGERFIHAFNNTPMGYGLPGAIGASFATGRRVVLVTGDGGLSVNIGELATVSRHDLEIKIILFNNRGHAMCRQTQRQWLGGEYPATSVDGGLAAPTFHFVGGAYGIYSQLVRKKDKLEKSLVELFRDDGPGLVEIEIDPDHGIVGQIKFGEPLAEVA